MVIDVFRKQPIHDAVILCNGRQNPYIKKDDGYYIFCDLQPDFYSVEIFSPGYVKKSFSCYIDFGECKRVILEMSYSSTSRIISSIPRILFDLKNKEFKYKNVKIILKTPINFMKLIHRAHQGDNLLILNVQEDNRLIFQNYIYKFSMDDLKKMEEDELKLKKLREENEKKKSKKNKSDEDDEDNDIEDTTEDEISDNVADVNEDETDRDTDKQEEQNNEKIDEDVEECFFIGYDSNYSAYILLKSVSKDLPMGGSFFPFWNLSIDESGKIIIPIFNRFMNKSSLEFEIIMEEKSEIVKIKTSRINKNNLLSSKVKFE